MLYTPETIIGATLPCGAKVVSARWFDRNIDDDIVATFDREPYGRKISEGFCFKPDGKHYRGELPDLTPPMHGERVNTFDPPEPTMTLRDQFAMAAIAAARDLRPESVARRCYEIADAMMAERAKAR